MYCLIGFYLSIQWNTFQSVTVCLGNSDFLLVYIDTHAHESGFQYRFLWCVRFIEESISSAYSIVRQHYYQSFGTSSGASIDTRNFPVGGSFIDLPRELFQMLAAAGPYLYRDTILLQKVTCLSIFFSFHLSLSFSNNFQHDFFWQVCRVLRGYYMSAIEFVNSVESGSNPEFVLQAGSRVPHLHLKEARLKIEEALGMCILPSLQLIPANPAVGQGIWEVMNLLPYEVYHCVSTICF